MDRKKIEMAGRKLIGSWQLVSWLIHYENGREPGAPFGQTPSGQLLYSADGRMSATVHLRDRASFPEDRSPRDLDIDMLACAYRSYFHYAGTWRIEGDTVIHRIQHSLNPNMVGTEQARKMNLEEPFLSLVAEESVGGGTRRHELIWRRAAS